MSTKRSTARNLRLLNPETGEIEFCAGCQAREDEIAGLQSTVRLWIRRYKELQRNQEAEAEADALWPIAAQLFFYWQRECKHPNARFRYDRFEEAKPYIKRYGAKVCAQAIRGAAYDPFVTQRKNGRQKRHDDWSLIFRSSAKFEDFAGRAPGLKM